MIFKRICRIFVKWFQPKYGYLYIEDLPKTFVSNIVYLIGEKENLWQAALICPCGCNSIIQLNLLKESRPRWKVYFDKKNNLSLSPSIHKTSGCKSHFFLTKGKIEWARSSRY